MDLMTICTVTVGIWATDFSARELRAFAKQVALPAGAAEQWDAIGTYTIQEGKAAATIKLYYADSDVIADKAKRRDKGYPNSLSMHAVYKNGDGPWKYKEIYSVGGLGFWKVVEVKPDVITLQVRSRMNLFLDSPIRFTEEEITRMYEPMSMRLTLKDGVPSLK
jgi:hypothetical protein